MATKKITNRAAKATTEITPADLGIAAAKADAARNEEREAMKASHAAAAPKAKKAAKKATKPAKATKTAKAGKPAKAAKPAADGALAIHINKTGRICFGKAAAERIGRMAYMVMTADGQKVRMQAHEKQVEGAVYINRAGGRPYVSATKLLKSTGAFDGTKALDLVAAPYNSHGFDFKVA